MKINSYFSSFFLLILFAACQSPVPKIDFENLSEEDQHKAENALASMVLTEGLEASVFAAEPTLINPTNINVDAQGRVWVIEALNYRNQYNPKNPYRNEGDRVLILEDTNGDGKSDKTTVFYQGEDINSALGIWVMGNKVIISSSPNVFMFTDSDGDDIADEKKVLFTNIKGLDHDHGAHAFIFGPDGRLYFNMGNESAQLQNEKSETIIDINGKPVITDGKNFRQGLAMRCNVDGSGVEVIGHNFRNNFELTVDSYGNVWQSDNDDDGNKATRINFVMEYGNYGYTDEMTGAGWQTRRVGMEEKIPHRHWHLNDPGVVPNLIQTMSGSPTGILFYEGELLPKIFQQQLIHCEPGHQVVRAYPIKKSGAGFTGEVVNVMKSKDLWFRPSDVCAAPDGSLYVADWYDPGVGGHKMGDVERGRIYRIAPKAIPYKTPAFDLNTPKSAANALQNPNLSIRYLAWNKLQNWGKKAEPALLQLWSGGNQPMRARALWVLARIDGETEQYLASAIKDSNPDIRITGLRAARLLDKKNLGNYLKILQNDSAPEVRREVAIALRNFHDKTLGAEIWVNIAEQHDGNDRWYLEALGIAADPQADAFFEKWLDKVGENWNNAKGRDIIWRSRSNAAVPLLTKMIADPDVRGEDVKRFFRAFHFHKSDNKNKELAKLINLNHPLKKEIGGYALGQINAKYLNQHPKLLQAVKQFIPSITGTPEWLLAVGNLGLKDEQEGLLNMFLSHEDKNLAVEAAVILCKIDGGGKYLENALNQTKGEEQKEFLQRMGWINDVDAVPDALLATLKRGNLDLTTKRLIIESLGNSWHGQHLLYDLLEANELEKSLITTAALKMMYCWDTKVRFAAPKYLQQMDGGIPLPPLNDLTEIRGDVIAGKITFETYCASCHQVNGEGINFGPDLSEIGSKLAKRALFSSIIYPSSGINFGYEGFKIKMKDDTQYNGFIISETEDEMTIRMMGGISKTIKRKEIDAQEEMKKSLMLENLHSIMGKDELVNLVEYLVTLTSNEGAKPLDF